MGVYRGPTMRKLLRSLVVTGVAAIGVALGLPAAAASAAVSTVGYDVSHPQCGTTLPAGQAFGIVGVNGGLATTANDCLGSELQWAWQSTQSTAQPKAQVYLNTANPGEIKDRVDTWPRAGSTPYGTCTGGNDTACSWQYGWERAQYSVTGIFEPAAAAAGVDSNPAHYTWWLDVETENTWQSGSTAALARNRATLEGMTAYVMLHGGKVGIYSTSTQFHQIAGYPGSGSTLYHVNSWLAGASTVGGAKTNCTKPPLLAGGHVLLAQYVVSGLDHDVSCR
jgi:hypothetical protein